ncbi:TonB-dependent receptor [Chitinophaga sancti]|uniref:TonB-dependent receptor n=1 Tax=Chitinophaga sancti TaxID=1004 RepID=A0A1K1T1J5_9BACT|nr:TonB-dependent receptor [Chitinophaga sancti]WQD63844.1 TonB-dependent receptor [Chitinophaga sancti]WQG90531.1 TonB-dependent receptor [Chitinophaga sancti]SFW90442.1 TonB-dependent Receptor Plug Domain [Chitinophaga sancti]
MSNRKGIQIIGIRQYWRPQATAVIFFICSLLSGHSLLAQRSSLNKRITISFFNIPVREALTQLSEKDEIPISFESSRSDFDKNINKNFFNAPVTEILKDILQETGYTWKYVSDEIIIVPLIKSYTISGHIQDKQSGEDLIGAHIIVKPVNQGTASNNYGFYSLTLPGGNYELLVGCMGYSNKVVALDFYESDRVLNIKLEKKISELKTVTVTSKNGIDSFQSESPLQLHWDVIRERPFFKGEADVIESIQMQNGVVAITEGSSSMFIRGGSRDQNLLLLDEAVVYNPGHLFGLNSIFNPDALKDIQLYKDDIPANFGGRLSSVLDTHMDEGNNKELRLNGGMSLLSARLSLEGPIIKERSSFLIAGRRSISNLLDGNFDLYDVRAAYYDWNLKANYKFNNNNRLFFSTYIGHDRVKNNDDYLNKWGNTTGTLRWNHIFNPKLFLNVSAIYSNYKNMLNINPDSSAGIASWVTGIRDFSLKGDFTYYRKPGNQIQFGFSEIIHLFNPGEASNVSYNNLPRARAAEFAVYFSQKMPLCSKVNIYYGLRAGLFDNFSADKLYDDYDNDSSNGANVTYLRLEPRLKLQYHISPRSMLQFSYNRNYQYLQLLQNDELAFSSLETWIPSSSHIKPQFSDQYSILYRRNHKNGSITASIYLKEMGNQLELVDHAQLISNPFIEDLLKTGRAKSYGAEFSLLQNIGKARITALYAWSRTLRMFDEINNGKTYAANYDVPHSVKLSGSYPITKSLQLNSYFIYSSGRPATIPTGYFVQDGIRVPIYAGRNLERMPAYHHLDINISWNIPVKQLNGHVWNNTISIGLYNLYNRNNVLLYKINPQLNGATLFDEQNLSGITPVFIYNFSF